MKRHHAAWEVEYQRRKYECEVAYVDGVLQDRWARMTPVEVDQAGEIARTA